VRVSGPCLALGEAAGTGAALSLAGGADVRAVPVAALRSRLESEGALLAPAFG
jgi:hypothetical protein